MAYCRIFVCGNIFIFGAACSLFCVVVSYFWLFFVPWKFGANFAMLESMWGGGWGAILFLCQVAIPVFLDLGGKVTKPNFSIFLTKNQLFWFFFWHFRPKIIFWIFLTKIDFLKVFRHFWPKIDFFDIFDQNRLFRNFFDIIDQKSISSIFLTKNRLFGHFSIFSIKNGLFRCFWPKIDFLKLSAFST